MKGQRENLIFFENKTCNLCRTKSAEYLLKITRKMELCSGPIWDLNLTWYTDNPDFTPCFHKVKINNYNFVNKLSKFMFCQ